MSHIKISSPFLREFIHSNVTITDTKSIILGKANVPQRRMVVIVQNQSSSDIYVTFSENDLDGIKIPASGNITLDNYNGAIQAVCPTGSAVVHVAYAVA